MIDFGRRLFSEELDDSLRISASRHSTGKGKIRFRSQSVVVGGRACLLSATNFTETLQTAQTALERFDPSGLSEGPALIHDRDLEQEVVTELDKVFGSAAPLSAEWVEHVLKARSDDADRDMSDLLEAAAKADQSTDF